MNDSFGAEIRFEEMLDADARESAKRPAFPQSEKFLANASAEVWPDRVFLKSPKDAAWIATLKSFFPYESREWSPAETAWIVYGPENIEQAIKLLLLFYPDALIER